MNRLQQPQLTSSSRLDLAVHLSLGVSVLAAVVFALAVTFDFCAHLDGVLQSYEGSAGGGVVVAGPGAAARNSLTNAAAGGPGHTGPAPACSGSNRPSAGTGPFRGMRNRS